MLVPSGLDATLQAVLMEDVLTAELNHCLLSQSLDVANDTEGVSVLS